MQSSSSEFGDEIKNSSSSSKWKAAGQRLQAKVGNWRSSDKGRLKGSAENSSIGSHPSKVSLKPALFDESPSMPEDASTSSSWPSTFPIKQSIPYLQIINRPASPEHRKLGETSFKYKTLDRRGREIRLLRILPMTSTSKVIECQIFHVELHKQPEYIAISYAWGDSGDTRSISLDGYEFPVTTSLWQMLHRLRSDRTAVTVWADAICIDQADINERNQQVEKMTTIYAKATSVAAWIGPEYQNSDLGIKLLRELIRADASGPDKCETILAAPGWTYGIIALGDILDRHYWYRLWTVQELFNAVQIDVYCGFAKIVFGDLLKVADIFRRCNHVLFSLKLHDLSTNGMPHHLISILRRPLLAHIPKREVSLLEAIKLTDTRFCGDPRDKIFGVLGIVSAEERSHIKPDYKLSKQQVYTQAVQHIISTTKSLDVLVRPMMGPQGAEYKPRGVGGALPTWLPDFSIPREGKSIRLWHSKFHASGNTEAVVAFFGRQLKLQTLAIQIDTLGALGSTLRPWCLIYDVTLVFLNWCSIVIEFKGDEGEAIRDLCRLVRMGLRIEIPQDSVDDEQWMRILLGVIKRQIEADHHSFIMAEQLSKLAADVEDMLGFDDQRVLYLLRRVMTGRRFCLTACGRYIIVAGEVKEQDEIHVLLGASLPVILRREGNEHVYVGEACVEGYMYGEAMRDLDSGKRELESVVLV